MNKLMNKTVLREKAGRSKAKGRARKKLFTNESEKESAWEGGATRGSHYKRNLGDENVLLVLINTRNSLSVAYKRERHLPI